MPRRCYSDCVASEEMTSMNGPTAETEVGADTAMIDLNTTVGEVIANPEFGDFGRLLFPVDRSIPKNMTLAELSTSSVYVWYSDIQPDMTVGIIQKLKSRSENGEQIFYSMYSAEQIASDPTKADTGLFFFQGDAGKPFAIMNAGGGFLYVGAMHDSFPHALEISKLGYNAFALIYRPEYAYDDLAQALSYIYDNAEELRVSKNDYSLWGGSAGARMAAALGNASVLSSRGLSHIPQATAVIMQYTSYPFASADDAPAYACVGTKDGIANWRTMQDRFKQLTAFGIDTEFHAYNGLSHGFGLGTGTAAEGWINDAVAFWEKQRKTGE